MKFGPVPVPEAAGGILAHSVELPSGRLRKGVRLEPAHVAALVAAGHATVVVAQLEDNDLHENDAAYMVATALAQGGEGIHLSEAFTGRTNLVANSPGVVLLQADAIHAANAIDPAVTVATVPPFHQIHTGGMVATVKIISYGVPKDAVRAASAAVRGAITLARPVFETASLIVTEIPGGPGFKGVEAIENRLTGLGIALRETLRCAHDEAELVDNLQSAFG